VPRRAQRRVILFFWPMRLDALRPTLGEPDLYLVEAEALLARDACQRGGEVF